MRIGHRSDIGVRHEHADLSHRVPRGAFGAMECGIRRLIRHPTDYGVVAGQAKAAASLPQSEALRDCSSFTRQWSVLSS